MSAAEPSRGRPSEDDGSRLTVALAGVANLALAIAKVVAGLAANSAALLAEAAHSFADTLNQAFLMTALQRSRHPADADHPFGYGKERYFWSLLAAVVVFVLGAGFSFYRGVEALVHPEPLGSPGWAFGVLGAGIVLDGGSLGRGLWQLKDEVGSEGSIWSHLRGGADPTVRAVVLEDSAAVIGVVLAAAGLGLDLLLDLRVFDALASLAIGAVLVGVAVVLGRQNQRLLIGQSAAPDQVRAIVAAAAGTPGVRVVKQALTMQLGPSDILVALLVDVEPGASGEEIEVMSDEVERRLRDAVPEVRHVYVDPTPDRDAGESAES